MDNEKHNFALIYFGVYHQERRPISQTKICFAPVAKLSYSSKLYGFLAPIVCKSILSWFRNGRVILLSVTYLKRTSRVVYDQDHNNKYACRLPGLSNLSIRLYVVFHLSKNEQWPFWKDGCRCSYNFSVKLIAMRLRFS